MVGIVPLRRTISRYNQVLVAGRRRNTDPRQTACACCHKTYWDTPSCRLRRSPAYCLRRSSMSGRDEHGVCRQTRISPVPGLCHNGNGHTAFLLWKHGILWHHRGCPVSPRRCSQDPSYMLASRRASYYFSKKPCSYTFGNIFASNALILRRRS